METKKLNRIKVILSMICVTILISLFAISCNYTKPYEYLQVVRIALLNNTEEVESVTFDTDNPTLVGYKLRVYNNLIKVDSKGQGSYFPDEFVIEEIEITKDMVEEKVEQGITEVEYKDGNIVGRLKHNNVTPDNVSAGLYSLFGDEAVQIKNIFKVRYQEAEIDIEVKYLHKEFVAFEEIEIDGIQHPKLNLVWYHGKQREYSVEQHVTAITNREVNGKLIGAFENADVEAVLWGNHQNGQPSVLDIIGENAFKGSKVSRVGEDRNIGTEFEAPNSLKTLYSVEFSVEKNAFANCENLEVVSLSQDNVDKEAFKGAINLKEIKVDYNGQQSTWTTFPNDPIYNGVLYPFRTLVPSTDNYWIWPEGKPKP